MKIHMAATVPGRTLATARGCSQKLWGFLALSGTRAAISSAAVAEEAAFPISVLPSPRTGHTRSLCLY